MLHTLRCSPCLNHPRLAMFDSLLRKGIGTICNLDLTDIQWLQASLPVTDGGLGVRRVSSLASSAFLASAAATDTLQQQLLFRSSIAGTTDASVSMVRDEWPSAYATDCPTGPAETKQSTWDRAVTALERQTVITVWATPQTELGCCQLHHPTAVIGCMHFHCPAAVCDLTTVAIHVAVGLRLGANICEPHQCPCGAPVDARGLHGLSCRGGNGRSARPVSYTHLTLPTKRIV